MPKRRPSTPKPLPGSSPPIENSPFAEERADQHIADFDENLWVVAGQFMRRRGSRTLDATDIDNAHAWLTRPPRKATVRDAIASVVIFLAAAVMAYGINALSNTPPAKGGWLVVILCAALGLFAEVFRRWDYE